MKSGLVAVRPTLEADLAEDKNAARSALINDCQVVYVQSVGGPAAAKIVRAGVHPMKYPQTGPAREVIARLQSILDAPPPWLAKILGVEAQEPDQVRRGRRGTRRMIPRETLSPHRRCRVGIPVPRRHHAGFAARPLARPAFRPVRRRRRAGTPVAGAGAARLQRLSRQRQRTLPDADQRPRGGDRRGAGVDGRGMSAVAMSALFFDFRYVVSGNNAARHGRWSPP